jgi:nucleoid-associated protein YgaU
MSTGTYGIVAIGTETSRAGSGACASTRAAGAAGDEASLAGSGDGVVRSVEVERTGLVTLPPAEPSDEPDSLARVLSASSSAPRRAARRASQSTPRVQAAGSRSIATTSSGRTRPARTAASAPSAAASIAMRRTRLSSAGRNTPRSTRPCTAHTRSASAYVGGASASTSAG